MPGVRFNVEWDAWTLDRCARRTPTGVIISANPSSPSTSRADVEPCAASNPLSINAFSSAEPSCARPI